MNNQNTGSQPNAGRFQFPVNDGDFRKAKGSSAHGCDWCVEVASKPEGVAIRNSKDRNGGTLYFTHEEFAAFADGVKNGEFGG